MIVIISYLGLKKNLSARCQDVTKSVGRKM